MNRLLTALLVALPLLTPARSPAAPPAEPALTAVPGSDGRIAVTPDRNGIYRLELTARAERGVASGNVVIQSAFGSCLMTVPATGEVSHTADYAAAGDLCRRIELIPRRQGVRLEKVSLIKVGDLPIPRQNYIATPEPNPRSKGGINPPTFRWPPVAGAGSYTVVYQPVGGDWKNALTAVIPRRNDGFMNLFFRPLRALAPGEWEWKLQVNGRDRSGPYRFSVSKDDARWDLEPWDRYYRRFATARPRLLFDRTALERIRLNASGAMKNYAARLVDNLEAQLGRRFDSDTAAASSNPRTVKGIDALMTVYAITRPIPEYLVLGRALNRPDFTAEALRRTLLLLERYHDKTIAADDDFANGAIMQSLAFTYDYLYDRLSPEQRLAIRREIVARLRHTNYPGTLPRFLFHAHAWQTTMHLAVSAAMTVWDEEPYAREFLQFSLPFYASLYPWFGGADGGSAECAHYGMETDLLPALVVRRLWNNFCGFDLAGNPWYRNSLWFALYSYPNDVKSSWFGDNSPDAKASLGEPAPFFAALYNHDFPNPYAAAFAARFLDLDRIDLTKLARGYLLRLLPLSDGPAPKTVPPDLPPLPLARAFRDTGLVIANSDMNRAADNITLEFRSSPYGAYAHAHADQNSFNLMVRGENLVVDSGYYVGWHDRHHYGYTIRTRAHNTILVDGRGQPFNSSYGWGRIAAFSQGRDYVWMRGDAAAAYLDPALEKFDRGILFLPDGNRAVIVIYDELKAATAAPRRFSWLLHLTAQPHLDEAGRRLTAVRKEAAIQVDWLRPAPLRFAVSSGFDPEPVIWEHRKSHFHDLPPQWHLEASAPATDRTGFITVLQVGPRDAATKFAAPVLDGNTITVGNIRITRADGHLRVIRPGRDLELDPEAQQPNPALPPAPAPAPNPNNQSRTTPAATPLLTPFQDGQTVCFAGDSITHNGGYIQVLADYYRTRYPGRKLRLINCGVGGDCIPDLLARLDTDVLAHRPDWLFVMLGMNDMNRRLYGRDKTGESYRQRRQVTRDRFVRNLEQMLIRLKQSGVKHIVIMSPTIYDQYTKERPGQENDLGADRSLIDFTALVADAARRHGLPFIDQHAPMLAVTLANQARDPAFTLIRSDRIHPEVTGHYLIARQILLAQGQTAALPGPTVDAATLRADASVSNLRRTSDGLEFDLTPDAMPMYLNPDVLKIPEAATFYRRLNRSELRIAGLAPGRYALSVNSVGLTTADAAELARGIDFATLSNHPWLVPALRVARLDQTMIRLEADKLRTPQVGVQMVRRARRKNTALPADDREAAKILLQGENSAYSAANLRRLIDDGTPEVRRRTEAELERLREELYRNNHPPRLHCRLKKIAP